MKQKIKLAGISIILGTIQMTTGINSVIAYASLIFKNVFNDNNSGIYGSIIVGIVNFIAILGAGFIIKKFNRKPLLLIGFLGCIISNAILSLAYGTSLSENTKNNLIIVMVILFLLSYQLAPGPIVLMLVGELFPEEIRTKYVGIGFTFNWIWNIIIVFTFKYFE